MNNVEPTQSLKRTSSWIIRGKYTKEVICETFNEKLIKHLKKDYEAIPILQYLQSLNAGT